MVSRAAAPRQPSANESKAAAAVLADTSKVVDRAYVLSSASVVSDCDSDSDSHTNSSFQNFGDWRDDAADMPLRKMMLMRMFKLFSKSKLQHQSSAKWRRKLPTLLRLIEAAHYQESYTRQEYMDTRNLKERIQTLALAFYNEMRKNGNVAHVSSGVKVC